jgi:hypothetical protein
MFVRPSTTVLAGFVVALSRSSEKRWHAQAAGSRVLSAATTWNMDYFGLPRSSHVFLLLLTHVDKLAIWLNKLLAFFAIYSAFHYLTLSAAIIAQIP